MNFEPTENRSIRSNTDKSKVKGTWLRKTVLTVLYSSIAHSTNDVHFWVIETLPFGFPIDPDVIKYDELIIRLVIFV